MASWSELRRGYDLTGFVELPGAFCPDETARLDAAFTAAAAATRAPPDP